MKNDNFKSGKTRGSVLSIALTCGAAASVLFFVVIHYQTKQKVMESDQANLRRELDYATEQAKLAKAANDVAVLNQVEEFRKTTAKNRRQEVLVLLREQEKRLTTIAANAAAVRADANALLDGEAGKKIALRAPTLLQAVLLFDIRLNELPSTTALQTRTEESRRHEITLENAADVYVPDESLLSQVKELVDFTNKAEAAVAGVKVSVNALKNEARAIVPDEGRPLIETLGQAIARSKEAEDTRLGQENIELIRKARQKAAATSAQLVASGITNAADNEEILHAATMAKDRTLAEQEALRIKNEAAMAVMAQENKRKQQLAEAEHAKKLKEAQDPAIRAKLAPFFASGFWQPGEARAKATEATPISLSRLRSYGALNRDDRGLNLLATVATTGRNERPKWDKAYSTSMSRSKTLVRTELLERQKLLIDYGEIFVELGYLAK